MMNSCCRCCQLAVKRIRQLQSPKLKSLYLPTAHRVKGKGQEGATEEYFLGKDLEYRGSLACKMVDG